MNLRKAMSFITAAMTLLTLSSCSAIRGGVDEPVELAPANVTPEDFMLGAGDSIEINVYRHDDLKRTVKIDPTGMMMYPLIGDVRVAGKGIKALREELQARLAKYLIAPEVTITVTNLQSQKVMVIGEVKSPSIISIDADISVMEAITRAGGMTNDAKLSNVVLIRRGSGREKSQVMSLDLKDSFKKGDISSNITVRGGDILYLPAVAIADVSRYFEHISKILSPIVNLESGIVLWPQVENTFKGDTTTNPINIAPR